MERLKDRFRRGFLSLPNSFAGFSALPQIFQKVRISCNEASLVAPTSARVAAMPVCSRIWKAAREPQRRF